MTLDVQFLTIIIMTISGFYLGIARDTFLRFSPSWSHHKLLVYLLEVCFWVSQTVILFFVLYLVNAGELRFYVFAACLLGFSMYQVMAANLYKKLLERFISVVISIYQMCKKMVQVLLITPVRWIIITCISIILFIWQLVYKIILILIKIVYWPIKLISTFIFRLLPESYQKKLHKIAGFYSTMKNTCIDTLKKIKFTRR